MSLTQVSVTETDQGASRWAGLPSGIVKFRTMRPDLWVLWRTLGLPPRRPPGRAG